MQMYNQTSSKRRAMGVIAVILLHVLMIWALISGLARDVVTLVKQKVEVKVIEDAPPPPPPPPPPKPVVQKPDVTKADTPATVQPKVEAKSPPTQVVKPEIQSSVSNAVQAEHSSTPVQSSEKTADKSAEKPAEKPQGMQSARGNCSRLPQPPYPASAEEDEVVGTGTVIFTTNASGGLAAVTSISLSGVGQHKAAFDRSIRSVMGQVKCEPNGSFSYPIRITPN